MPPAGSGAGPRSPLTIEQLAEQPDALCWAKQCGWIVGAGYCCNRACAADCVFRCDFEADRRRVQRRRSLRRRLTPR